MIYFVQAASGPIKIGYTNDWGKRRIALQAGNPDKLTTLLVIPGEWSDEQALHRVFATHRVRSEWFAACPEILAYIELRRADHIPGPNKRAEREAKDKARSDERSALIARLLRCYYDAITHRGTEAVSTDLGVGLAHLNRLKRWGRRPHWWILERVAKVYGDAFPVTPASATHLEDRPDASKSDPGFEVLERVGHAPTIGLATGGAQ